MCNSTRDSGLTYPCSVCLQVIISGLSRVLCMQQERQLRRRQLKTTTGNHVTRGNYVTRENQVALGNHVKQGIHVSNSGNHVTRGGARMKIRSPALPFRKWEPPLYQPRDSPTDDGEVIRRPSRVVVGDHPHHHATNHLDATGGPPSSRQTGHHHTAHRQRLSVDDAAGVVVHRSVETRDTSGRRRASAARSSRKAGQPAAPRRRDHPPRRPASDSEPPAANSVPPTQPAPLQPFSHDPLAAVPIICNYVDPAPVRPDENPSPPPVELVNQAQLLAPPASSGPAAGGPPTTSGVEIGAAVENEVREVKRMLRSFMAKLSQRDVREPNPQPKP